MIQEGGLPKVDIDALINELVQEKLSSADNIPNIEHAFNRAIDDPKRALLTHKYCFKCSNILIRACSSGEENDCSFIEFDCSKCTTNYSWFIDIDVMIINADIDKEKISNIYNYLHNNNNKNEEMYDESKVEFPGLRLVEDCSDEVEFDDDI